ncbi:sulfurtransferase [Sphingobacterium sp. UT-1RO-CII-1]|uniref:sulfurtransferase n=1 Tax=Sphingobacterium sp. UT-1RO-CII-1 TaxID=2995225 RepID=UPI00227ACDD4|nr:sulfurtransferase [Sphingobacterium sp. UT-1RO-CII-1]MCY4778924.1 sulfurtransferase [Sphingobacterium sp. UT-1RO-CII-1]
MNAIKPIISTAELLELQETANLILVDATTGEQALETYRKEHLADALFVDMDNDLSVHGNPAKGGRHPLPEVRNFVSLLNKLGINNSSHVIVYDRAKGINAAARFWWMLSALGHEKVQVIDGGFQIAKALDYPISNGQETPRAPSSYQADQWTLPQVDISTIEKYTQEQGSVIIDVRDENRYQGLHEPIDLIAGHIPTAINIPLSLNLDADGRFKTAEELRKLYTPYFKNQNINKTAVHCGSGVSACHTLLALKIAGLPLPALYVGSWSEWSRNEKPIAKGKK